MTAPFITEEDFNNLADRLELFKENARHSIIVMNLATRKMKRLRERLSDAEKIAERLNELLTRHQWKSNRDGDVYCGDCGTLRNRPHAEGCAIHQAIAAYSDFKEQSK